jgi:RES domain-containing protein
MLKLQELMEDKITFDIPIDASIKMTEKNWGEAYGLAKDGYCKKHGKLAIPNRFNETYCEECKKKYIVVPYTKDTLKQVDNMLVLEKYKGELTC